MGSETLSALAEEYGIRDHVDFVSGPGGLPQLNLVHACGQVRIALQIFNSVVVAIFAVALCLFFSATSGYGFAKYRFKGNAVLFMVDPVRSPHFSQG